MGVVPTWVPVTRLAVVATFLLAALVLFALRDHDGRPTRCLRQRLLLGVPWGSLVVAAGVLAVYLLLQDGLAAWGRPVAIPFRAWSYFYPLGMLAASFSHFGPGHLIGNLVGTLTLGSIAEYAWGHYPRRRGAVSFGSARANPYARAFVLFPAAVVLTGLLTALFSVGPVIGFSGVVFAFAGFALVSHPIATVVALTASRALRVTYLALREPVLVREAEPVFSTPWWADIALQGHALGLLVGVLVGIWWLRRRDAPRPSALRLWIGVVLFGFGQSLWALYWFRGSETFVLYRGAGVALLVALGALVAAAVAASDRSLVPGASRDSLRGLPRWAAIGAVVLLVTAAVGGVAIPTNLAAPTDEPLPGETITVRDYEVAYAENVTNGMVSVVEVEALGESTEVNTSGVIVRSRERGIWMTAVSRGRLAFAGGATVSLGGVGWREPVAVRRTGWTAAGGNTTYRITADHGGRTVPLFAAPPAEASPVIGGREFAITAQSGTFWVAVEHRNQTVRAPVPAGNQTVTLRNVSFVRRGDRIVANYRDTRLTAATRERYPGQD